MPRQPEPSANNALGNLLRKMMRGSGIYSETTQTSPDYSGRHADVLVTAPGRSPVAFLNPLQLLLPPTQRSGGLLSLM